MVLYKKTAKMNEPTSHVISVRAIEDIIQIQKIFEDVPNLKSVQMGKEKSDERVVYSILKHDYSSEPTSNRLSCLLKECDVENSFKCNEKNCKRLEMNGWEGDYGLTKYINPDVVVLENIGILEGTGSENDVKCWSSDSDVTVLRVKKEFRNELSNKVEWEEQRNLGDDASISSANLDWEYHSLINLAGIVAKEKDAQEGLKPFTIWSKTNDRRDSATVRTENVRPLAAFEPCNTENAVPVEKESVKICKKSRPWKKQSFRNFFRTTFSCFHKKKSF